MKKRVWELDAFRGICILAMVMVHLIYDLVELYGLIHWDYPQWFRFVKDWGGVLFILVSGISATLGHRSIRRGLTVLLCGMVCTAVTYGMYRLGMAGKSILIYFGVLHCLGCCMILWALFKKLPGIVLAGIGIVLIAIGFFLRGQVFSFPWLMPLGFLYPGFQSSDYFPLILNFGFFLTGAALGHRVYPGKKTLLPKINEKNPVIRFLTLCGRNSLWIYLLHQPVLSGITMLIAAFAR